MIRINKRNRTICFHKEYEIGSTPEKTKTCKLISAYTCPKCKEILLAYFRTDEFIRVWRYDEDAKDSNYDSESDRRYYRYRVFYAGCGLMGIELKEDEHNSSYKEGSCSFEIRQCYNIIESVNQIQREVQEKLKDEASSDKEKSMIIPQQLPDGADKNLLVKNLEGIKEITLIHDICRRMDPLIHFNMEGIKYREIETWKLDYGSKKYKQAKRKNFENRKKAYTQLIKKITANPCKYPAKS